MNTENIEGVVNNLCVVYSILSWTIVRTSLIITTIYPVRMLFCLSRPPCICSWYEELIPAVYVFRPALMPPEGTEHRPQCL